jgi:general stress protein YciG
VRKLAKPSASRGGAAAFAAACWLWLAGLASAAPTLIVVEGAAGAEEYAPQFAQWRQRWEEAGRKGGAKVVALTAGASKADAKPDDPASQRALLKAAIEAEAKQVGDDDLWLVLLGHGTFDGKTARFNLQGPDVSAEELADWLKSVSRPTAVINCSSASAPFLAVLKAPNRVVIAATRSGHEVNFSRFGEFISQAIADPAADLDKDGQTSLLEAYLLASRQTQAWYRQEGRLATEHALIDDNGDGLGTPAEFFRGVRAVRQAAGEAAIDGLRAHQWHLVQGDLERSLPPQVRKQRNDLELRIAELRQRKAAMKEDEYYAKLEELALQLARLMDQQQIGSPLPK